MNQQDISTLITRPAGKEELDLLYTIQRDALKGHSERVCGPWNEEEESRRFHERTVIDHQTVIERDGVVIGFYCAVPLAGEIRLARLMILPHFQNRGIGSSILQTIIEQAERTGLAIRLRVLNDNPAIHLYQRFGFDVVEREETHVMMVRQPAGKSPKTS